MHSQHDNVQQTTLRCIGWGRRVVDLVADIDSSEPSVVELGALESVEKIRRHISKVGHLQVGAHNYEKEMGGSHERVGQSTGTCLEMKTERKRGQKLWPSGY